jgi:hypothetical protein
MWEFLIALAIGVALFRLDASPLIRDVAKLLLELLDSVERLLPECSCLVRDSDFALTFESRDAPVKRGDELAQLLDEPLATDLGRALDFSHFYGNPSASRP